MSKPKMEFFFDGDSYFAEVFRQIDEAQTEILLESYIFNIDTFGKDVLQHLTKARQRGVTVKILTDGIGSMTWVKKLQMYCRENLISLRVYRPLPLRISWQILRRFSYFLTYMNKRDHRKLILIDRKIAFIGSFNISQEHLQKIVGEKAWRDSGVKITEIDFTLLTNSFHKIFRKRYSFDFQDLQTSQSVDRFKQSYPFRFSSNWKERMRNKRILKKRILAATKRVLITTPYFVPSKSFAKVLMKAAQHGAYVCICIPHQTDVPMVRMLTTALLPKLMKSGVKIYEYKKSILHAKTIIVDDWAALGSHNLNHRSLFHDHELEVEMHDADYIHKLIAQWDLDISNSDMLSLQAVQNKPIIYRMVARIIFQFRYWL